MTEHKELSVWLVQIERFLRQGAYLDAIARAKRVVEEARAALENDPNDIQASQLLALGRERLSFATKAFEAKNEAVSAHRLRDLRAASER